MRAWFGRGLAVLVLSQTIGCERLGSSPPAPPVRYHCMARLQDSPGADWTPIEVTRARHGEAYEAAAELHVDLVVFTVKCGELDQGLRGSPSSSEGGSR